MRRVSLSSREKTQSRIPVYIYFLALTVILFLAIIFTLVFSAAEYTERRQSDSDPDSVSNSTCISEENECGEDESRGVCWRERCVCEVGWHGARCELQDCENVIQNCTLPEDCSRHGECYFGKCVCEPGYIGVQCQLRLQRNRFCSFDANNCGEFGECVLSETYAAECYCPIDGQDLECMIMQL